MRTMKSMLAAAAIAAMFMSAPAIAGEKLTVASFPAPQGEILEKAASVLADQGYDLEVITTTDYTEPNRLVSCGEADANYFQHVSYLYRFNEENGTELVNAGGIHYEPFGIYPGTKTSLEDIAEGDVIAVANDAVNEGRALLLLRDNGIIDLAEGAGLAAMKKDIIANPNRVKIQTYDAAQVFRTAGEAAYIVLDARNAVKAGLSPAVDALALEAPDTLAAHAYAGVIAVGEGNENSDKIRALVDVLLSEEIVSFINDTYDGAVLPFTAAEGAVWQEMGEHGSAWEDMTEEDDAGSDADDAGAEN